MRKSLEAGHQPYRRAINLKTAKALGLNIPQSVLLQADEVINEFAANQACGVIAIIVENLRRLFKPDRRKKASVL